MWNWVRFHLLDSVGTVESLIEEWEPGICSSEKEYEISLLDFMRKRLEGVKIISQYGIERAKVDIVIGSFNKVAVELKKDLRSSSEMQRLIGQMPFYKKKFEQIIILLCGDNRPDLVEAVKEHCGDNWGDVKIIEK